MELETMVAVPTTPEHGFTLCVSTETWPWRVSVNVQFSTGAPVINPQNGLCDSAATAGAAATRPQPNVNNAATRSFLIGRPRSHLWGLAMGPLYVEPAPGIGLVQSGVHQF